MEPAPGGKGDRKVEETVAPNGEQSNLSNGNNQPPPDKDKTESKPWSSKDLEFYAEFGPMRVELDKQLLLKALLDFLGIKEESAEETKSAAEETKKDPADGPKLIPFPSYSSPGDSHDPQYDLRPEEKGKSPLQLLKMAMLRIVLRLKVTDSDPSDGFCERKKKLHNKVTVASVTQENVDRVFDEWLKELTHPQYWDIQTTGELDGIPLYSMGFWNLLSDYLSHDAILKLRDLGTFYHLIAENPNAAEWFVWWLIGLGSSEGLKGIHGGMECIIDSLYDKIREDKAGKGKVAVEKKHHLESLNQKLDGIYLNFADKDAAAGPYQRVILALPKCAVEKAAYRNLAAFGDGQTAFSATPANGKEPEKIPKLLKSAFAFSMVKLFVIVKNRWWGKTNRANRYATRVPTRELHYWAGLSKGDVQRDSNQGMVMLYTDRPASTFWANYVAPGNQEDVNMARLVKSVKTSSDKSEAPKDPNRLTPTVEKRMLAKIVQYLNENNVPDITVDDIAWYGIRDWGRDPYGGANHAWRPERKYWITMAKLGDIQLVISTVNDRLTVRRCGLEDQPSAHIHICGEAYSDYHGFMEGSLRSALYTLHRILGGTEPRLEWLGKHEIVVDPSYLKSLQSWVADLDQWHDRDESCEYKDSGVTNTVPPTAP